VRFQWNGPWELYNVKKDRTEQQDLSKKYPDRVKELAAKWNTWAKADNVLPVMHENHEKVFHATVNDGYGGTPPLTEPGNNVDPADKPGADD
jgi:hypothetical protein